MESKKDSHISAEKDGIKFHYIPLEKTNAGNQVSSTTLKAIKGINNYEMTIASNGIERILPIAKNDIDIFNKVIVGFLTGTFQCKYAIEVQEEVDITIDVEFEFLGETKKMQLTLEHEEIESSVLLQRKIEYLTEKVREYEETKIYYLYMGMKKIFNISDGTCRNLDLKELYKDGNSNPTPYCRQFIESKTEGYFKEISNYDLFKYLEENSEHYKTHANDSRFKGWTTPQTRYYDYLRNNHIAMLEIYLMIIGKLGYELAEISLYSENYCRGDLIGLKVKPTKIKYNYVIECDKVSFKMPPEKNTFYTTIHDYESLGVKFYSIKKTPIE